MPNLHASFSQVIHSPEFRAIMQRAMDKPFRANILQEMPIPSGSSEEDILDCLTIIMSCAGVHSNIEPWFTGVNTPQAWFFLDKETRSILNNCATLAARDAHINRHLGNEDYRKALFPFVIEEVVHLAKKDGLNLSVEEIEDLMLRKREASTPQEMVIENFTRLFLAQQSQSLTNSKDLFSRILMNDIYKALTEGADGLELQQHLFFSDELSEQWKLTNEAYASASIDQVIQICREARNIDEVIIASITMSYCLWDIRFFPQLCGLTEYLIRSQFFMMNGCAVLAYIPHFALTSTTFHDYLEIYESEYLSNTKEGINGSWIYSGSMRAFQCGLEQAYGKIHAFDNARLKLEEEISALGSISARQKLFLLEAIKEQAHSCSVREYEQRYEVTNATARKDLTALANMGYLEVKKTGGVMHFQIHPDLSTL